MQKKTTSKQNTQNYKKIRRQRFENIFIRNVSLLITKTSKVKIKIHKKETIKNVH